jgi:hypothetical protein
MRSSFKFCLISSHSYYSPLPPLIYTSYFLILESFFTFLNSDFEIIPYPYIILARILLCNLNYFLHSFQKQFSCNWD